MPRGTKTIACGIILDMGSKIDNKIRIYEIIFAVIALTKTPFLTYFFMTHNGWFILVYFCCGVAAFFAFCDFCLGKVIAKKCNSAISTVVMCLVIAALTVLLSVLLFFLGTGGSTIESCADYCEEVAVVELIPTVVIFSAIPMVLTFFFALIYVKKLSKNRNVQVNNL